ncbi:hypothetical protein [Ruminococcus sp.]|uniref:hypothetical protein n=1 Tax=Ruminococcus sp. TaxID=41978 RepID=UPI0025CDE514|nr:hypothetical protein [Ruminococcus sp.]MCR4639902.1 hypothetical protein [Ruminococcus sp.]
MGKTKRIIAAVTAALMTMNSSALIQANAVDETVNISLQSVSETESKEYTFNEINAMTTEDVVNLFTEKGLDKDNGYKVYGQGNDAEYVYCFSWNVYLFSEDFLSNRTVEEILTDYAPSQDGDCLYDKGESLWDTNRIVSALALPEEYFEITVFKNRVFVKGADSTDKNKIACNCEIRCKLPEGKKRAAMRNAALNYLQLRKDFDKLLIDDAVPYYGKEKTVAQKYGEAIADYMANNDIQGVVSRSVPDEKLSIGFHGDHEEQLMAYITEIGLDESGIPYEIEKLPDFTGFNDLIVTTAPQPTATTIAVTGTKPVTTITMPVLDDPTIQTEVVTVTVMSVNGDDILVKPVDGSPELKSSNKFSLSANKFPDDIKPKAGMKLEITYNGGILETYPAQFGNVQKIVAVKDDTVKNDGILLKGTKDMTLNDVMRLAEKGDELDWSDFKDYKGRDVGSGLHIWEYKLEDGYVLDVGGDIQKKPIYILLSRNNDKGIDIRTEDVKEYIASTATPVIQNTSDNTTKEENFRNIDMYIRQYMNENNIDGYSYFTEGYSSFVIVCKTKEGISQVNAFVKEKGYNADRIEYKLLDLEINAPEKVPEELDGLSSLIADFMKNNGIGGTADVYNDVVRVVLDRMNDQNGRTLAYFMEQCGIDKTKVIIDAVTFDNSGGRNDGQTSVKKNLLGDANCDGQVDLSDAVMIMQALANPNKYGIDGTAEHHLTEQGKLNGDMDGDGLTVGDAQAIQRKLLGLENVEAQRVESFLTANAGFLNEKGTYTLFFIRNGNYFSRAGGSADTHDEGTWTISGDTVVLTGKFGTNRLSFDDNALIYIAEGSEGFNDFNPKDGEKFNAVFE